MFGLFKKPEPVIVPTFLQVDAFWTIGSGPPRESSDSASNKVDEPRPAGPINVVQPSSTNSGRRFAALLWPIAGLAAVVATTSVSFILLVHPTDEKHSATTVPALTASPTDLEDTPAAIAMGPATSPKQAPELAATNPIPAPAVPPEAAAPIVAIAPGARTPDTAPTAPIPAAAAPLEEAAPIVAIAPGALAPDTAPTAAIPAAAAPQEEAAPIVAAAPAALAPDTAPTAPIPAAAIPPEEVAPIVGAAPSALTPNTAPTVPTPATATPPAAPRTSTVEIAALLARGDSLFGAGDVCTALLRARYRRRRRAGGVEIG